MRTFVAPIHSGSITKSFTVIVNGVTSPVINAP